MSQLKQALATLLKQKMRERRVNTMNLSLMTGVLPREINRWKNGEHLAIDSIENAFSKLGVSLHLTALDTVVELEEGEAACQFCFKFCWDSKNGPCKKQRS
jgi:hypothetical protein